MNGKEKGMDMWNRFSAWADKHEAKVNAGTKLGMVGKVVQGVIVFCASLSIMMVLFGMSWATVATALVAYAFNEVVQAVLPYRWFIVLMAVLSIVAAVMSVMGFV